MILCKKNINQIIYEKRKSFTSIIAISTIASLMAIAVPVSMSASTIHNATGEIAQSKRVIVLNQKSNIVESVAKKNNIVLGESKIQREEREAGEAKVAEENARLQAEAAVKVASESATKTVSRTRKTYADPANMEDIYIRAQAAYGVDARILKAVHYVETGCSGSTGKSSYAGAVGPMQFIPSTWRAYGVDGNGDGSADITNVEDAIFSAARYLSACGYPNVQKALYGYNPSRAYYAKVMDVAYSLGY